MRCIALKMQHMLYVSIFVIFKSLPDILDFQRTLYE